MAFPLCILCHHRRCFPFYHGTASRGRLARETASEEGPPSLAVSRARALLGSILDVELLRLLAEHLQHVAVEAAFGLVFLQLRLDVRVPLLAQLRRLLLQFRPPR